MPTVKQYKSETVLFFAVTAIASVITELAANPEFKAALGDNATFIILGMSVVGYILRRSTTKPVEPIFKRKEPPPLNPLEQALKEDNDEIHGND